VSARLLPVVEEPAANGKAAKEAAVAAVAEAAAMATATSSNGAEAE
jgi:hypothetical protein